MKIHSLILKSHDVQAIIQGRKTQARGIIKPQPHEYKNGDEYIGLPGMIRAGDWRWINPKKSWSSTISNKKGGPDKWAEENAPWKPGDLLYVRETWGQFAGVTDNDPIIYRADGCWEAKGTEGPVHVEGNRWRPSVHMPRSVARIWLQVESVRVERLQDISLRDAIAEGVESLMAKSGAWNGYKNYLPTRDASTIGYGSARKSFETLWQSVYGPESWEANPWVWAISFKVLSTTGMPELAKEGAGS